MPDEPPRLYPVADQERRDALYDEMVIRATAVANCQLCDDDGYRLPNKRTVCDHEDHRAQTASGRAAVQQVLDAIAKRRAARQRPPVEDAS